MRKLLLGVLGLAAIGLGAASVQPAQAQPYYGVRAGPVEFHGGHGPREYRGQGGYRSAYYPGPHRGYGGPRHGYYRQAFAGPRCFVRMERAWNGWGWVNRPVRICR